MASAYGFSSDDAKRIGATVKRVEQMPPDGAGPASISRTRPSPLVHPVEVTSTTPDADGYLPGTCLPFFDPDTGEVSGDEAILILDLNA